MLWISRLAPYRPLLITPEQPHKLSRVMDFFGIDPAANQHLTSQTLRSLIHATNRFMGHTYVPLLKSILDNSNLPFYSHAGSGALAMNIHYEPVSRLREYIESRIGVPLNFFKLWNPNGEAHVTVITPPEYTNALKNHVTIEEIEDISAQHHIQESDLQILGIGHGQAQNTDGSIQQELGETFFLIVHSINLMKIRRQIQSIYL